MSERRVWRVFPDEGRTMRLEQQDVGTPGIGQVRVRPRGHWP